ncbi:MAG: energy transducer TonB [Pseudomonadota bacterium]
MSAYATSPHLGFGSGASAVRAKAGPLATIVVSHLLVFYFIYSGLLTRIVRASLPEAVMVTFVAPPQAPPQALPLLVPKPSMLAELPPPVVPQVPVVITPSEHAISVAPAPAPVEKVAAPVASVAVAAPPAASGPRTLTSGVEYLQAPQPVYPPMSRRMGEQGRVVLRVLVNEKGQPDQVTVQTSSGSARLDEAGRQAALRALFKPHMEDGRPAAVFVIVPLNFTLAS